jgi:hypothetical protein
VGHEERSAPPSLSAGYEFRKETNAGTQGMSEIRRSGHSRSRDRTARCGSYPSMNSAAANACFYSLLWGEHRDRAPRCGQISGFLILSEINRFV